MKEFVREYPTVNIDGKDYNLRELSLSEKNKLIGGLRESIKKVTQNIFFKKKEDGGLTIDYVDEISFAELDFDKIILGAIELLPELLKLAVPDFKDWDNLPESESRAVLIKAIEVQDFKGFIANFFSLGTAIIR